MEYSTIQGVQGICPQGWHISTDAEWKILEGTVDSQYGVGDPEWENTNWRGFDAGKNLKSTSGWYSNGNGSNDYEFTALPGGYRNSNGDFGGIGTYAPFWSSSESQTWTAWRRLLLYDNSKVIRNYYNMDIGFSVRCVKD